jgi:hypothetical protein
MSQHAAILALVVALFASVMGGCQKLNPSWCAQRSRCSATEYCDPSTNTCRPREMGFFDQGLPVSDGALLKDGVSDFSMDGLAEVGPDLFALDTMITFEGGSNPDGLSNCTDGHVGWFCWNGSASTCENGNPSEKRRCPLDQCAQGHCALQSGALPCTTRTDCGGDDVCTLLLSSAGSAKLVCTEPVAGAVSPEACTTGLTCATGLCTEAGFCYYPCYDTEDCPSPSLCQKVNVNLEGIDVEAESCQP